MTFEIHCIGLSTESTHVSIEVEAQSECEAFLKAHDICHTEKDFFIE